MYKVLSPLGESTIRDGMVAPRLADLSGKTVCEVWNGSFKGDVTFPIIREMLQKRYRDVKIIPYTEFPLQHVVGSTGQLKETVDATLALARQKGCDAMITGNGF